MTSNKLQLAKTLFATATIVTTVLSLSGVAFGVAPADYGLKEGDTISAAGSSDPDIYIVNDWGYKRLFLNPAIFNLYGHLSWAGVKSVTPATRDAFVTSGLYRNCETGDQKVYGIEATSEDVAVLHWVNTTGAQAVADDANFFKKVFCINTAEMALYGSGTAYTSVNQVPAYVRGGTSPAPSAAGFNPAGGTQGSIDTLELGSPAKSEALEGQSNVEVYAVDATLTNDGPLMLQSADIWFANTAGDASSEKPWDYVKSVSLLVGGKKLATLNADSSTDWTDYDGADRNIETATIPTKEYRLRFTGLSGVLVSDDTTPISVAVTMNSVIDTGDDTAEWSVELGDIRVLDESGLVVTENTGADSDAVVEDIFTVGGADEAVLKVADAASKIDAAVVEVDTVSDTNGVAIYKFTIEETNGVDVDISKLQMDFLTTGTTTEASVIRRARILEGSTQRGADETVISNASTSFDNVGIHINGDQKKEFTVEVDLKDNDNGNRYVEGTLLSVNDITLEEFVDENSNDESDIVPAVTGSSNLFELRSEGVQLELVSTSESKVSGDDASDQGTFVIKYKVTAFGADAFIQPDCTNDGGDGVDYDFTNGSGTVLSCLVTSTADLGASSALNFEVQDGTTETFTLSVTIAGNDDYEKVFLQGVDWDTEDITDPAVLYDFNLDDFETDSLFLSAT